jgi:hypothetical protein
MSDDGWVGSAPCVSADALRHQEARVRDEFRRLSRVWRTTPPRGAVSERTGSRDQSLGELGAAGGCDRLAVFAGGYLHDEAAVQDAPLALG